MNRILSTQNLFHHSRRIGLVVNHSIQNCLWATFLICACALVPNLAQATPEQAQLEILVKGATAEAPLKDVPSSATVISQETIVAQGDDHLQNVLALVPNLNWAGGSNRPRFFQIRGIGELEQYEGAPNPSVGLLIDDVDLSGIGTPATLFDIDQIEVLRGPQSIRYGASALAGIISLHSTDPTPTTAARGEFSFGSDNLASGGFAVGGSLPGANEKILTRISVYHNESDGFRHNQYLDRNDTNGRDETTLRAKTRFLLSPDTTADLSLFVVDLNNGYDAFAIDNSFTTQSDRPGQDAQQTEAAALRLAHRLNKSMLLESVTTGSNSDIDYSYDGDWGNNPFWEPYAPYDYFSDTNRERTTVSQEFRVRSEAADYVHGESLKYLAGVFVQRLDEDTSIGQFSDGAEYDRLDSSYRADTGAVFGHIELPIVKGTSLGFGLRGERRVSKYNDSRNSQFDPAYNMLGGELSLSHDLNQQVRSYLLISRGFKGGGFNAQPSAPADKREYQPEYLWNYEAGVKGSFFKQSVDATLAAFYSQRHDQQVRFGFQSDPTDPLTFIYLTDNAAKGKNLGLEAEAVWRASETWSIFGSGALLDTEFSEYDSTIAPLQGRDQSHAPHWQYAIGTNYQFTDHWFARIDITGKDAFYFDDSNDQRSRPYSLVNAAIGYQTPRLSWTIWARNLFDKKYAVRGFYFGDEPPDFPNKRYEQQGDPLQIGTTLTVFFG